MFQRRSAGVLLYNCSAINNLQYYRIVTTHLHCSVNKFTERSHNCGQLSQNDIGKRVTLFGWVIYTRFDNKILALRDSYGTVQCIVDLTKMPTSYRKTAIHNESVVRVSGSVQARPTSQINKTMESGTIEVLVDNLEILNNASQNLPMLTRDDDPVYTLVNKLKYRYLYLRAKKMQDALRFRSKVCDILRRKLIELNFIECETPTLFRRTPGGANEFIVPTQTSDMFFGLTQSPQQLKQLLMIGGLDRYFQICRCYRDESGRTDRQPEFTQLDIELSFTNQDLVMKLIDQLMFHLMDALNQMGELSENLDDIFDANRNIERMDYKESIERYGCDKPDTRFGWLISESSDKHELSIDVPFEVSQEMVSKLLEVISTSKSIDTSEFVTGTESSSDGGTRVFIRNKCELTRNILGQLRLLIASELNDNGQRVYNSKNKFIWVTGFPLFESNEDGTLTSSHHPFTSPTRETAHLLIKDPTKVIGQHYDLVLNGQEVAGGSIRVHDAKLQQFIFKDILKLDDHTFEYFIEALKAGCPPHGGIAIGLDRLIAILLGRESIRDVIAFPKSNVGRDLMSGCPHAIDAGTKKMYHLN